jgi:hypothetical protein
VKEKVDSQRWSTISYSIGTMLVRGEEDGGEGIDHHEKRR